MSILSIYRILKRTGKERRELGEREMIHPTEDDLEEYKRQDREDKGIAHLEERRRREPPIGDPCPRCDGEGKLPCCDFGSVELPSASECPQCEGTGSW